MESDHLLLGIYNNETRSTVSNIVNDIQAL